MCKIKDELEEQLRFADKELLETSEPKEKKFICEWCKDAGIITRTEWTDLDGKDMDYEVETICSCRED